MPRRRLSDTGEVLEPVVQGPLDQGSVMRHYERLLRSRFPEVVEMKRYKEPLTGLNSIVVKLDGGLVHRIHSDFDYATLLYYINRSRNKTEETNN